MMKMKETADELKRLCRKIISNFELLKVVSYAEVKEGRAFVFDPPYVLEIAKDEELIILKVEDEELAILTPNSLILKGSNEDLDALSRICKALTSMNFRRYLLKTKEAEDENKTK